MKWNVVLFILLFSVFSCFAGGNESSVSDVFSAVHFMCPPSSGDSERTCNSEPTWKKLGEEKEREKKQPDKMKPWGSSWDEVPANKETDELLYKTRTSIRNIFALVGYDIKPSEAAALDKFLYAMAQHNEKVLKGNPDQTSLN